MAAPQTTQATQTADTAATTAAETRVERDSLGDLRFPRRFIRAIAQIKGAAAEVNMALGLLDERVGRAIVQAAREVADGALDDQFVLDIFQTGSGTSTNMNANEVLASRAN